MKLMWLGYLIYSLGNCAMKLYIETGLKVQPCLCSSVSLLFTPGTYNSTVAVKFLGHS
jgi:hypothetical protein